MPRLLVVVLLTVLSFAQAPPKITAVEGITEYRLTNGLSVLLFPDQTKATITVNITYKVGSRHENYGETGMAHLLEHLLFKGSPKHTNIPQELTEHGARPNGTTWYDRTNYYETFAASEANLRWALDLEADRMVNSFVAKKDLDSEMTVVRNEFEAGENSPSGVLEERVLSTAYLWHNYAHSTIGSRADIENVPIDRLQAFYRTFYQPDNAVLLVAGKFDEAKTLALIQELFGKIPKPTRKLPGFYTQEPAQDGERQVTLRRTGDLQVILAAWHVPAAAHPDFAAADLLTVILGDQPSGRLHKALVETKKASGVGAFNYTVHDPGTIVAYAEVRKEQSLDDARETFLKAIDEAIAKPPTAEEVDRARTNLLKQIELTLNSADRVGLQLSEFIGAGDWRLFFLHRDRIRKATPADVQRAAATYLRSANRTLGLFIPTDKPERAEIPATPNVAELLKDYKGDQQMAQGEAFDPSPANIESRTKRITLANGMEVALLSKRTRGGTVVLSASLRYGDENSLRNRSVDVALTADMLLRGTARHTRQQIKDEFDRLKARVNVGSVGPQATISVETVRENLPAVLKLLVEVLREPSFPESEFEQLRQKQLAGIEEQRKDPQTLAGTAFQRHIMPFPKGDIRYISTPDEDVADLKAVTLAGVKRFYTDFYGAGHMQMAVVGDFDEAAVTAMLKENLENWKSVRPFARVPRPFREVPAVNQSFEAPDKANAFFVAGMNLILRDDDPEYPALVIANYLLGGGFLNSRLAVRLRQKDGLSYAVGSQIQASSLDHSGQFVSYAIYAPQNAAKLETGFKEEVARVIKDGFTAEELKAGLSGYLQNRQVGRAQDGALARSLANNLFLKRTLQWDAEFEKKVAALTPEQVSAAFRKYVSLEKLSTFKAGDFAKKAQD